MNSIRNCAIRNELRVAHIADKMSEAWCSCVLRGNEDIARQICLHNEMSGEGLSQCRKQLWPDILYVHGHENSWVITDQGSGTVA